MPTLEEAFNFTADDLHINATESHSTSRQQANLYTKYLIYKLPFLPFPLLLIWFTYIQIRNGKFTFLDIILLSTMVIILSVVFRHFISIFYSNIKIIEIEGTAHTTIIRVNKSGGERKSFYDRKYIHELILDGYIFKIDENQLNAIEHGSRYRIYILPLTNDIISIEKTPHQQPATEQKILTHWVVLKKVFHFSGDDLAINRMGALSAQQKDIKRYYTWQPVIRHFLFTPIGTLTIVVIIMLMSALLFLPEFGLLLSVFIVPNIIFWNFGDFVKAINRLRLTINDLKSGQVEVICDEVVTSQIAHTWKPFKPLKPDMTLSVSNKDLLITPIQYAALNLAIPYCIYYLPRSKRIVSLEISE